MTPSSLLPHRLGHRLLVAFSLMSVVPLLVLGYIVTNLAFPSAGMMGQIGMMIGIATLIAFLGLAVARNLVLPVVKLATQAQEIAGGQVGKVVDVGGSSDEVSSLGSALNQITHRIRENMSQLRVYGEQTKHLNLEINRRMMTLSHLLQVSNLISQSARLEQIVTFILEKLSQMEELAFNCLLEVSGKGEGSFVVRMAVGPDPIKAQALNGLRVINPWLGKVLRQRQLMIIDEEHQVNGAGDFLKEHFGMTHAVIQPIVSMGEGMGLLISANDQPGMNFKEEWLDLLKVFAKQMTIAMENDLLARKADELRVVDELTGAYNSAYMKSRLDEEVRRARRYHRPCSLLLMQVDDFQQVQELYGGLAADSLLRQAAQLLKGQISEVDRLGRMGPDEFAIILPECNKREALDLAETIRAAMEKRPFSNNGKSLGKALTVSVGVSENPIDGATAEDLFAKAAQAMQKAYVAGKNRVSSGS